MLLDKVIKEWYMQMAPHIGEFMGKFFKKNIMTVLNLVQEENFSNYVNKLE